VSTGICGKRPDVAALQDLLFHTAMAVAACSALPAGEATSRFIEDALFTTVTNVSFDPTRIEALIRDGSAMLTSAGAPGVIAASDTNEQLRHAAERVSIASRIESLGPDVTGLQELLAYGLKGVAAYGRHARVLGRSSAAVDGFMREALTFLAGPAPKLDALLGMNMRCGEAALRVLELLDGANTGRFGQPVPTSVAIGHRTGRAILVSGHDLADLGRLLEMTAGRGVDVYTHGEMLPAHGYPELNKHPHLAGHFGGAWQNQTKDFAAFPGAILMTTNCLMPPLPSYRDRVFTTGVVAFPGLVHLAEGDFTPLIEAALAAPGFTDHAEVSRHTVGFGHNAVLGVADAVIGAIKSGALKRFVLIGGCDGTEGSRSYFSDLAEALPSDWAVLTLGCGKFRVLDHARGNVGPLPRLIDMGQCNDAYSAIKVAGALAEAFGVGVNDLPLNLVLSWFEQKAVAVLLALLHLGVKNIRIGPRLPAFITPAVLQVLVEKFNIMPITDVAGDIRAMAA
jgi:hydroxylamine reductase